MAIDVGTTLQRQLSQIIRTVGVPVTIYRPATATLPDNNAVGAPFTLAGTSTASIQQSRQAEAQAAALGIYGTTVAMAAFLATASPLLTLGGAFTDTARRCWLIRSQSTVPEWSGTAICSVWLVSLIDATNLPDGITL